jgi:hypothetical protein
VLDGNLDVNPVSFLDALRILDVHGTLFDHLGQNVVEEGVDICGLLLE